MATLSFLIAAPLVTALPAPQLAAVLCSGTSCTLQEYHASPWTARANLTLTGNITGWSTLTVTSNKDAKDEEAAFAAGFIEGALTTSLIDMEWLNLQIDVSDAAMKFVLANNAYVRGKAAQYAPTDPYWSSVGNVYSQYDGMVAGYKAGGGTALTPLQILYIGLQVELGDIEKAVNASARPDWAGMSASTLRDYIFMHSHCSAMIKVLPDLSELYAAHNTWFAYGDMGLRLWKVYNLPFSSSHASTVSFPGYPGKIAGIDDFYVTSQKLVVIETTNSVFTPSLFDQVVVSSVPYWARVTAANRLAVDGPSWHTAFYKYNSGTYVRDLRSISKPCACPCPCPCMCPRCSILGYASRAANVPCSSPLV